MFSIVEEFQVMIRSRCGRGLKGKGGAEVSGEVSQGLDGLCTVVPSFPGVMRKTQGQMQRLQLVCVC